MTEVFVLDTETTGLSGGPEDLVVEIGISKVDLSTGDVEDIFASFVGWPESTLMQRKNAWVFKNTDMNFWKVIGAPRALRVIDRVREILCGELVTSYNTEFDLDRFLYRDPWSMKGVFSECNCVMTQTWKAYPNMGVNGFFPRLQKAYDTLCPDDPSGIHGKQSHRALSDANMAANVLYRLYRQGKYRLGAP